MAEQKEPYSKWSTAPIQASGSQQYSTSRRATFSYIYVLNQVLITRIDILLTKASPNQTAVSVTYERTALDPAANEHLKALAQNDSRQAPEWQAALDAYAAKQR